MPKVSARALARKVALSLPFPRLIQKSIAVWTIRTIMNTGKKGHS